jgi:adenosylhomocysteinase
MAKNSGTLDKTVHRLPEELDREIARIKLEGMGIHIDTLTADQQKYLSSWEEGT